MPLAGFTARAAAAFSELYRGHPFIRVPEVIDEASGDRVLSMTYLDGLDWAAAQQANQDRVGFVDFGCVKVLPERTRRSHPSRLLTRKAPRISSGPA
jgi:predicted unusual protein kinase regulating ubiquinone biosynthesis (AarF/ABC1/UbiB family)